MGHKVPSPVIVLEGEVLPRVDHDVDVVEEEAVRRLSAFNEECNRAYREVSEENGGDPLDNSVLLRVIKDPWSNPVHIPKKYRPFLPGKAAAELPTSQMGTDNKKQGQLSLRTRRS